MDTTIKEATSIKEIIYAIKKAIAFSWKNERLLFIVNIILSICAAIVLYLQIASFSKIIDEVIRIQKDSLGITPILIKYAIFLGLSFLIPSILDNIRSKVSNELRTKLQTHLNIAMIDYFSKLDIATVEGAEFQKKMAFAEQWGLGSIVNVIFIFIGVIRDMAGLFTAAVILISIKPLLVVVVVIASLPGYVVQNKYGVEVFRIYNERTDDARILSDRRSFFKNSAKMVETLLFNISAFFRKQIYDLRTLQDRKIIRAVNRRAVVTFLADLFSIACLLFAVFIITIDALNGVLAIGSMLLAFSSYRSFDATTKTFFYSFSQIQDQSRYAKRWFDLFEIKPQLVSKEGALKPIWSRPPRIEFRNVYFSYPETDKIILHNISFVIESGEKIAIVGENGAGKTTTIKLLARVYDPTEGTILIDGEDLRNLDIDHWRSYLGVLFQDFSNFNMTAREAIGISRPNEPINDEKIIWAAKMAGADDFIQTLPKKYDQILWKGFQDGVELSKGQHQRMAVARIFYRDALISVLDEPTSAIDAVAEEKIFEVLETKMDGKTGVLISHRFSTVKNADQIAVIEHGELKELGNHKDLMAKKGRYAELYTMQASRYLESE